MEPEDKNAASGEQDDRSAADERLKPGGARGVAVDVGMSGVDVDTMPWRVERPARQDSGSPREERKDKA